MALNWQPPSLCNSVGCLAHLQLCLPETLLCLALPTCPRSVSCTDYLQSCLRMPKTTFPSPKSLNRHSPSLRNLLISVHRPSCCSQPHGTAFVLCTAYTFTCPRMPKTTFPGPKSLNWQSRTLPVCWITPSIVPARNLALHSFSVSCTDYLQSCLRMPKTTFPSPKSLNRHSPSLRKLLISVHRPASVLCAAYTFTCPRMPKTTFPGPKSLNWQSRTLPELSWP